MACRHEIGGRIHRDRISFRCVTYAEDVSMSDYAHTDLRAKMPTQHRTIESRALYGACYLLFLGRAVAKRMAPWQRQSVFGESTRRESILNEAKTAAGVVVSSSFMGM
jgi:hypothetical protein